MIGTTAKDRIWSIVLHAMAWLVLIILPQLIIDRFWGSNTFIVWGFYLNAAIYGVIFYVNYIWLVPQLYMKNRKAIYVISAFVTIIGFYFLYYVINKNLFHNPEREKMIAEAFKNIDEGRKIPRPPYRQLRVYYFALISVIVTGFSIGLRVIEQHSISEKKQKELEKEKLNSELAFLKNQVSPHFFFNTLNNIYSLIEINTKDAQEAVLKLSKLMRYLLYESERGETMLSHEIDFMKHYIDLMKLRLSGKVKLNVDFPEEGTQIKIPPLLFIPFIENAFKHGISYREKSFISVLMKVENGQIIFNCENSIGKPAEKETGEKYSGIGLDNVKKRLALLFPGKNVLNIESKEKTFHVHLEIELS